MVVVMLSCIRLMHRTLGPLRDLLVVLSLLLPVPALADALRLDTLTSDPLGRQLMLLQETDGPMDIGHARQMARDGAFSPGNTDVPTFGISAPPVWVTLTLDNPTTAPLSRQLLAGTTWIDRLDLYLVQNGKVVMHQTAGDTSPRFLRPTPGVGYVFTLDFAPGRTELFLRVANPDPLLLPMRLLTTAQATAQVQLQHYGYGIIYGFLLALLAYNALLYLGLRQRSYGDYSIYLGLFILMNVAYTGHGYAWFWPEWQGLQRYVILVLMVLFACSGLRFASDFLDLPRHSPRLTQQLRSACLAMCTLMALAIALDGQQEAALLAFGFMLLFTMGMVMLGWDAVRHKRSAGRYFLAAACSGMAGTFITTLTVWGWLPYREATFHAAELGIVTEATLLALAVAYHVRQHDHARRLAEALAHADPLTGLLNRRAFLDQAEERWNRTRRHQRPLALIILDLDHFKTINDTHGHATGDAALRAAAGLIQGVCRRSDLAARWGGEEFILLLPETTLAEAKTLAERLRKEFASRPLGHTTDPVWLRASFGVAVRDAHYTLEELINEADTWLYRAKQNGRDQVCSLDTVFPSPSAS